MEGVEIPLKLNLSKITSSFCITKAVTAFISANNLSLLLIVLRQKSDVKKLVVYKKIWLFYFQKQTNGMEATCLPACGGAQRQRVKETRKKIQIFQAQGE